MPGAARTSLTLLCAALCACAPAAPRRGATPINTPRPTATFCQSAPRSAQFAPSGLWLACQSRDQAANGITLFSLLDTRVLHRFSVALDRGELLDFHSWAPDSSGLIYTIFAPDGSTVSRALIMMIDADGVITSAQVDVLAGRNRAIPFAGLRAAWAPGSRYLAVSGHGGRIIVLDRALTEVRHLEPRRRNENIALRRWDERGLFYFSNARTSGQRLGLSLVRVCGDHIETLGDVPAGEVERYLQLLSARSASCSAW